MKLDTKKDKNKIEYSYGKRKSYTPEFKAKVVLELLREEKSVSQIASEYEVHPNLLSRWKAEAIERMPELFDKRTSETEKLKKDFEAEK
jgi:transposase-like protein